MAEQPTSILNNNAKLNKEINNLTQKIESKINNRPPGANNTAIPPPGLNNRPANAPLPNNRPANAPVNAPLPNNRPANAPLPNNRPANASPNNNNYNNNNNNINNNNNNNSNKSNKSNKKENENKSFIGDGISNIGNSLSNIKNQIIGTNNKNKTNININKQNTNSTMNKNKENENKNRNKNKNNKEQEDEGESISSIITKVVIMIIVLAIIFYLAKYLLARYTSSAVSSSFLLNTSKNGKYALIVSQDPTNVNYIPINKSEERDGIQFTYGFWFLIEGFDYKKGEWKHIFHKGNSSAYPNRAPGVWIHPDKNAIRVYMNSLDNIIEYADVENIPIRKWIYMNIVLNNKNLDLYINGYLKIRKELTSLPKQNDGDFWVNMFGGFEGYVSNIKYYSYAIDFNEMNTTIRQGPSINNCINTGDVPPYLDDDWWFDYNI